MTSFERFDWRTAVAVVVVAVAVVVAMLLYSDGDGTTGKRPHHRSSTAPQTMSRLEFAVWGNDPEIAAYKKIVDAYNEKSVVVDVHVDAYRSAAAMLADIRSGALTPDLYLLPRDDLAETMAADRNRPVLDLLDARGIAFGDEFARDAISAFSADDTLQCMPYSTSPMVIYYNADLIDFDKMAQRDLPVPPEDKEYWTLEQFRAAAEFASRPRKGTKGVYIQPTLTGLAPFVYAGGGKLFDDDNDPTSLDLSGDSSADALRQTLEVLRDPTITLTNKQVLEKPALEWFKEGKLGMVAGFRDLTPELRATPGLDFDIMPMPELDDDATVGDLTGVCVAEGPQERVEQSADFLVDLLSDQSVTTIVQTGYLMPTKIDISFSDAFIQPHQQPRNGRAFVDSLRSIVLPPLITGWPQLEAAVDPDLERLLTQPLLDDLDAELRSIDDKSKPVLNPEDEPSDGPSNQPGDGETSGSPSSTPGS